MNIKVKALEWAEHPSGKPLWRAHAPNIGWYGASAIISPASWQFDGLDETVTHDAADIDAAKAAAQADYERRILSAIEPSPDMRKAVEALTAPGGSTTAFTCDQLARLAFVVFYSPVLCAPQNIKAVVDEIDCCPGCDHVSNGGTCIVSERGDYCPNDLAETLRQISVALYGPGNPSHYVESVFGPDQMPVFHSLTGAKP